MNYRDQINDLMNQYVTGRPFQCTSQRYSVEAEMLLQDVSSKSYNKVWSGIKQDAKTLSDAVLDFYAEARKAWIRENVPVKCPYWAQDEWLRTALEWDPAKFEQEPSLGQVAWEWADLAKGNNAHEIRYYATSLHEVHAWFWDCQTVNDVSALGSFTDWQESQKPF